MVPFDLWLYNAYKKVGLVYKGNDQQNAYDIT